MHRIVIVVVVVASEVSRQQIAIINTAITNATTKRTRRAKLPGTCPEVGSSISTKTACATETAECGAKILKFLVFIKIIWDHIY